MQSPHVTIARFDHDQPVPAASFSRGIDIADRHLQHVLVEAHGRVEIMGAQRNVVNATPR
jgi:hypothetical protein